MMIRRVISFLNVRNFEKADTLSVSESFIRSVSKSEVRYNRVMKRFAKPVSYHDLVKVAERVNIDQRFLAENPGTDHLFIDGDHSVVPASGVQRFLAVLFNEEIEYHSVSFTKFVKCEMKSCVNPAHVKIVDKRKSILNANQYSESLRFVNRPLSNPAVSLVKDGVLNLEKWAEMSAADMAGEAAVLSRDLCESGKVTFIHEEQAVGRQMIIEAIHNPDSLGGAYQCPKCNYWHLTSHLYSRVS